jgi:hypothetical protein
MQGWAKVNPSVLLPVATDGVSEPIWGLSSPKRVEMNNNQRKVANWFKTLTPEKRLEISLEIEEFRREAKLVKH